MLDEAVVAFEAAAVHSVAPDTPRAREDAPQGRPSFDMAPSPAAAPSSALAVSEAGVHGMHGSLPPSMPQPLSLPPSPMSSAQSEILRLLQAIPAPGLGGLEGARPALALLLGFALTLPSGRHEMRQDQVGRLLGVSGSSLKKQIPPAQPTPLFPNSTISQPQPQPPTVPPHQPPTSARPRQPLPLPPQPETLFPRR